MGTQRAMLSVYLKAPYCCSSRATVESELHVSVHQVYSQEVSAAGIVAVQQSPVGRGRPERQLELHEGQIALRGLRPRDDSVWKHRLVKERWGQRETCREEEEGDRGSELLKQRRRGKWSRMGWKRVWNTYDVQSIPTASTQKIIILISTNFLSRFTQMCSNYLKRPVWQSMTGIEWEETTKKPLTAVQTPPSEAELTHSPRRAAPGNPAGTGRCSRRRGLRSRRHRSRRWPGRTRCRCTRLGRRSRFMYDLNKKVKNLEHWVHELSGIRTKAELVITVCALCRACNFTHGR